MICPNTGAWGFYSRSVILVSFMRYRRVVHVYNRSSNKAELQIAYSAGQNVRSKWSWHIALVCLDISHELLCAWKLPLFKLNRNHTHFNRAESRISFNIYWYWYWYFIFKIIVFKDFFFKTYWRWKKNKDKLKIIIIASDLENFDHTKL